MKSQHIGKLLPADGYQIRMKRSLHDGYSVALTHLYQPLLGLRAVTLYQTMVNDYVMHGGMYAPKTHHLLMTLLDMPMDQLYEARLQLEAIGLIRTYKQQGEQRVFTYDVYPPFTPAAFFADDMLSQLLYHQLGESRYKDMQQALVAAEELPDAAEEITASFEAVFSADKLAKQGVLPMKAPAAPVAQENSGPSFETDVVDFEWLRQSLKQRMLNPEAVLTPRNQKLLESMAVLYNLTSLDLDKAMQWAVSEDNVLNPAEFKSACHDLFLARPKTAEVKVMELTQKDAKQEVQATSKQEKLVHMLETISPKQLLEDISGNGTAAASDLKVIRDVMAEQGMAPGIMNVLVYYVLLKSDMKLSKAYMEKIAAHWARKKVSTVREAMEIAKSSNQPWNATANNNNVKQPAARRKNGGRSEIVPEWFDQKGKAEAPSTTAVPDADVAEMLKQFNANKRGV
ncbi:replication initiation and membrane attachment family protein [Terribacillus sp. DMT04]|uniref:replication initiation and membrane attachment family protein n=1 Tax=Terribacillus sp. DMT04 TaxID=2850441 RepID=UPI001C2C2287|nr:DnaD domain protein [Terribacillus sp. DMT04]QXE00672.1 DnaD domain protein [Terribacillus sp. DMT04]